MQRLGVTVRKASPDLMMVVHMISPDGSRDQQYISNYATLYIKDALARVDGVGDVNVFGARDYSMRIWLDPGKVAARGLTAGRRRRGIAGGEPAGRRRRDQPAAGACRPARSSSRCRRSAGWRMSSNSATSWCAQTAERRLCAGARHRARRTRLAGLYDQRLPRQKPATAIVIYQRPGSNALGRRRGQDAMAELTKDFPPGLDYYVVYNPTEFIQQSIDEAERTLLEAIGAGGAAW